MPAPERSLVADDELRLLADVVERLERLDEATRRRVCDYLFDRYGRVDLEPVQGVEAVTAGPWVSKAAE